MSEIENGLDNVAAAPLPGDVDANIHNDDGDALDRLLAEYDAGLNPAAQAQPTVEAPPQPTHRPEIEQRLDQIQQQMLMEESKRDYGAAVSAIRGDADARMYSDGLMSAWIDNQARMDPQVTQAWLNRRQDPGAYRRAVDKLGKRFHTEVVARAPDRHATEDRDLVTAAVRGASAKQPEAPPLNYGRLTDQQFAAEKDRMFGG